LYDKKTERVSILPGRYAGIYEADTEVIEELKDE